MFENLKQQITQDLQIKDIENLDDYIYELHEILPKYLKQVPEQSSSEFYEFAAKFLQYIIDEDLDILDNDSVCDVFIACPNEICEVMNSFASQSGEDITSDIIKIISSAKSLNIVNNEKEAQIFLDSIFANRSIDWTDINPRYIICNWNQVMLMTGIDNEDIEDAEDLEFNDYVTDDSGIIFYDDKSIAELEADGVITDWYQGPGNYDTYNDFTKVSDFQDEDESDEEDEDDPNFGIDALFSFVCVTGPDSADQALELIYKECGWVGHPEDEIEAGTDFPHYGVVNQDEADNFNANMNAIFEYYDSDPNEFALACIDPEAVEELNDLNDLNALNNFIELYIQNSRNLKLNRDDFRKTLIKFYPNIEFDKWIKISNSGTEGIGYSSWSGSSDKWIMQCKFNDKVILTIHYYLSYGPIGETNCKIDFGNGNLLSLFSSDNVSNNIKDIDNSVFLKINNKFNNI